MVFDDLQWADGASLNLIETILLDGLNKNSLLMVGMYRSNEVSSDAHILSTTVQRLKDEQQNGHNNVTITEIHLGNLGVDQVNETIMALLSIDNEIETLELATICHKRTGGNLFFSFSF